MAAPKQKANQLGAAQARGLRKSGRRRHTDQMILPFFKSTMQKITIAALAKRGAQLDAQRSAAQAALTKATKARQDALIGVDDLDDQQLAKLQRTVSDAVNLLQGIDEAIGILAQEKADAEARLAAERDRVARDAAAEEVTTKVLAIEKAVKPWLDQSRMLADALAELHWHFECGQVAAYVQNCATEVETALNFHASELNAIPKAIRDGSMPVPAPKPALAASVPAAAVAQEQQIVYSPIKAGPRFRGAPAPSAKLDPVLAAAGFRVLDRSSEERAVYTEGPNLL